ncbi:MAG: CRISPR-associated endonuclease Cas2 [Paludibacteraceae bacterium]|nr:CRISPR-associated endonuclease Cas2 [Paludibacteraceae bacterium]
MYILVTYDVQTETPAGQKRLRKVARLCMDYGLRVQNSVFECVLTEIQLAELKHKLEEVIDLENDSIRIYYLNRNENRRIITVGKNNAVDVEDSLII